MRGIATALVLWLCVIISAFPQMRKISRLSASCRLRIPSSRSPPDLRMRWRTVGSSMVAISVSMSGSPRGTSSCCRNSPGRWSRRKRASSSLFGAQAIRAAQQATNMIPIVANADLLAAGLIQSLARPGGNTTGVSMLSAELDAKRLEILKEILPSARRIALLTRAGYPAPAQRQAIADLAHMLGVELETVEIRDRTDLASAFVSLRAGGVEAINVLSTPTLFAARAELGSLSLTHKLPAICEWREMAEAGCLASNGFSQSEAWSMLAALTEKMLKGAPPGETPAQQPTKFELVLNLKVARKIGVEIPFGILGRADEVIE